jgi:hypothetical protein
MKYEPAFIRIREWYFTEKSVTEHSDHLDRITDLIIDDRRYSQANKVFMLQKKAKRPRSMRLSNRAHLKRSSFAAPAD